MSLIGIALAAGEGAHHDEGPFYASPEFWVAVALLIFLVAAGRKIMAVLGRMLDDRSAAIARKLNEAEQLRLEAEALLAQYQKQQQAAVADAQSIVQAAHDEAARLKVRAAEDLANALKLRERQATDRIAQAEQKALADVRNLAVDTALAAAQQILRQQVETDRMAQATLIDSSIAELPKRMN